MTNEVKNVPEIRFPEFSGEWEENKLNNYLKTSKIKNTQKKYNKQDVLSVSGDFGIVNQIEFQGRSFAGASVAPYGIVETGDIVYTKSPLKSSPYGIIKVNKGESGIVSTLYAIYKIKKNVDANFVEDYFTNDLRLNKYLKPLVNKGAKNDMKVSDDNALIGDVIFPKYIEEQIKISKFFSKLDRQIELEEQKLSLLEKQKKGYMQKIFSQELRFKDENGEYYSKWEKDYLGNRIKQYFEKTKINNEYPVLTSSREGIFLQKDYFTRDVASKDNTGYNVVPYGYFTYRHMSDDLVFKFNINTIVKKGIVSTLYPVFKTKDNLNSLFLKEYLNHGTEFKRYALLQKQGGSRTYMYFNKLIKLELKFPILNEQNKISNFLNEFDELVEKQNLKVKRLKERKKGFLQKMFV